MRRRVSLLDNIRERYDDHLSRRRHGLVEAWRKPPRGWHPTVEYLVQLAVERNGGREFEARQLVTRVLDKYRKEPSTAEVWVALYTDVIEQAHAEARLGGGA